MLLVEVAMMMMMLFFIIMIENARDKFAGFGYKELTDDDQCEEGHGFRQRC